jgi:hypothetical protein
MSRVSVQVVSGPATCPECNGRVVLVAKAGRWYRTASDEIRSIPADMIIPTCTACGLQWIDNVAARRHEP